MSFEINDRITSVRKELSLSQTAFGERIGVSRSVIQNIDDHNTDPKPLLLKQICKEFNVNPYWLETGNGNKFLPKSKDDELHDFVDRVLKDEPDSFKRRFLSALSNLNDEDWVVLEKILPTLTNPKEKEQDS